ncbi:MAG: hypothetical protein IGS50_02590 [Synechococcales cyanobacterium C42_A2020_086]|jgi:hypothetical protein|nr:hypothetical protein [Synechococcales cyanobacterium M58_A2018_015]MBF2072639.1 hypothetical protein [Synechococcales cyanobacterium C42_A2020_086]
MPRPSYPPDDVEGTRKARPLTYLVHRLVIAVAFAIIAGLLLSSLSQAFAIDLQTGSRSLAAAALPPIVLAYATFFSRTSRTPRSAGQALEVNLYIIALIWTLVLLILVDFTGSRFNGQLPLGEFAISSTLSTLVFLMRQVSFASLLSCAYGILSGFLVHILLFGLFSR